MTYLFTKLRPVLLLLAMSGIVLSFTQFAHAADMYTWVDSQGVKHYSDKPRENAVKLRESISTVKTEEERSPEQIAAEQKQAEQKEKCDISRKNVKSLDTYVSITRINDQGEKVVMTEEEMAAMRARELRYQSVYCDKDQADDDSENLESQNDEDAYYD
ncbi:MAG: DUF4124 domain-containing protein [Gammaproteobacteria bacterium]|nr:DUF4124 domain-containing protein [Gammaproteobacteria bacterium]NNM14961.1 DUF4124 domain-containing protein [Gammaproteobacteria bacterium]